MTHLIDIVRAEASSRTAEGRRFLELQRLLTKFLVRKIEQDRGAAGAIAAQIPNVLRSCDQITYEDPGTAEAYALLHFLDRFRRFQLIFCALDEVGLLPVKGARHVNILDVGTGPGPSMFAASDFFSSHLPKSLEASSSVFFSKDPRFTIDYVERSAEFRNWLHHFTEFVNYCAPSGHGWQVPFHHGTFRDFRSIEFNQPETRWRYVDDGDLVFSTYIRKHRFDMVVFSNFLTSRDQVREYTKEIENCARYLRNNGILIVVGAKGTSSKYRDTYGEISKIVLTGLYSNHKFRARCERIELKNSVMRYSWSDPYGARLKQMIKIVYEALQMRLGDALPHDVPQLLTKTLQPDYSKSIEWEVLVFKKRARPKISQLKG